MKKIIVTVCFFIFVSIVPTSYAQENHETVLLIGVDAGEGRIEQGRSDVLMILDINKEDQSGVLASIPRDSYVDIPGYGMDKINHAYAFGGSELTMATLSNWLGIEMDAYIAVNMTGLKEIVEVVGSITVVPPTSFSIGGYSFTEGVPTELTPDMALQYSRERYTSGGDYGRQGRQRDVVVALIDEAANVQNLFKFTQLFNALTDNMDTNLSLSDLFQVFRQYYASQDNIVSYQLQGSGVMIDGVYYEEIFEESMGELLHYFR